MRSAVIYQIKMDGESLYSQFYCFGQRNVIECFHSNFFVLSSRIFIGDVPDFLQREEKRILEIFLLKLFISFLITEPGTRVPHLIGLAAKSSSSPILPHENVMQWRNISTEYVHSMCVLISS